MEAVRLEERKLGPIPFPWLSFTLGFVALPLALLIGLWLLLPLVPVKPEVDLGELLAASLWFDVRLLWLLAAGAAGGFLAFWSSDQAEGA